MKIKGALLISLLSFALGAGIVGLIPGAQAFTLGPCKWQTGGIGAQFLLYYFNDARGVARTSIEMAVQAWYDVPIPLWPVPVTSEASANIIFRNLFQGDNLAPAENNAVDRCLASGFYNSPITITLYNSFRLPNGTCCGSLDSLPEDQVVGIAAHELGHALGLAHNNNLQSLMFGEPFGSSAEPYNQHRIFVPVYDDIRGVADLYGWCCPFTSETFAATAVAGSSSVSGRTPPLTLRVSTPAAGSYAQAYCTMSLPDPLCSTDCFKIAVMMAIVTPLTLYRFHMGWERGSGITQPFVTVELDNDGVKLVTPIGLTNFTPDSVTQSNTPYFLELVVKTYGGDPSHIRATAYAHAFAGLTGPTGSFLGSFQSDMLRRCITPRNCAEPLRWQDASQFDVAVWTDSASNPGSYYSVERFWNIQGDYATKFGGGGGGGSVAHGSLITMADGRRIPVQNLVVGDRMLGYDTVRGQFTLSIVLTIVNVDTVNMLIINTEAGIPMRVDANPAQTLWARQNDGTVGWVPVTQLRVGEYLFNESATWVRITGIEFAPSGIHAMFDIIASAPYFANGYLDPQQK